MLFSRTGAAWKKSRLTLKSWSRRTGAEPRKAKTPTSNNPAITDAQRIVAAMRNGVGDGNVRARD